MKIITTRKTKRVEISFGRQIEAHERSMRKALHDTGQIAKSEVKRLLSSGRRTGRLYRFGTQVIQASAAGEVPARRSGRLIKSSNFRVHSPYQMALGESAPYAGFLEEGTRRMASRPHLIVAINNTQGQAIELFYRRFLAEQRSQRRV